MNHILNIIMINIALHASLLMGKFGFTMYETAISDLDKGASGVITLFFFGLLGLFLQLAICFYACFLTTSHVLSCLVGDIDSGNWADVVKVFLTYAIIAFTFVGGIYAGWELNEIYGNNSGPTLIYHYGWFTLLPFALYVVIAFDRKWLFKPVKA